MINLEYKASELIKMNLISMKIKNEKIIGQNQFLIKEINNSNLNDQRNHLIQKISIKARSNTKIKPPLTNSKTTTLTNLN